MPQLNEEQQKDVEERKERFKKGYEKLILETQVEIMYKPEYVPVANQFFGTIVVADFVDIKYRNPSPIHAPKN